MAWKILKFHHISSGKKNPFLQSFWGVNQLYTTDILRDMENHTISTLKALPPYPISPLHSPKIKRFSGHFRLSGGHFKDSTNFNEMWILGNFGAFGPKYGTKYGFHPLLSLITKPNLKIDSNDSKTAAALEFAILDDQTLSLIDRIVELNKAPTASYVCLKNS